MEHGPFVTVTISAPEAVGFSRILLIEDDDDDDAVFGEALVDDKEAVKQARHLDNTRLYAADHLA